MGAIRRLPQKNAPKSMFKGVSLNKRSANLEGNPGADPPFTGSIKRFHQR